MSGHEFPGIVFGKPDLKPIRNAFITLTPDVFIGQSGYWVGGDAQKKQWVDFFSDLALRAFDSRITLRFGIVADQPFPDARLFALMDTFKDFLNQNASVSHPEYHYFHGSYLIQSEFVPMGRVIPGGEAQSISTYFSYNPGTDFISHNVALHKSIEAPPSLFRQSHVILAPSPSREIDRPLDFNPFEKLASVYKTRDREVIDTFIHVGERDSIMSKAYEVRARTVSLDDLATELNCGEDFVSKVQNALMQTVFGEPRLHSDSLGSRATTTSTLFGSVVLGEGSRSSEGSESPRL